MNKLAFIDFESDDLVLDATKIHVMGYWDGVKGNPVIAITDYGEMVKVLSQDDTFFVCHNVELFDALLVKKLLGFDIKNTIDTLPISHYLRPSRIKHSLESYQEEVGIGKVAVEDWVDGSIELYSHRVIEDVKLNANVFFLFMRELKALYGDKWFDFMKLLTSYYNDYREHYYNPFKVDMKRLAENLAITKAMVDERVDKLKTIMPPVYEIKTIPSKPYKKDGTLSEAGKKWFLLLEQEGVPLDSQEVKVISEGPNPASPVQVKDWLLSLGWKPEVFKDGANGPVPQTRNKDGELCQSIVRMNIPETNALADLSVISNRHGNLKRMRDNTIDGYLAADIGGLTNTLRIKHRTLVNITKVSALHGGYERSILTCDEDEILIGSDLASLENYTRTNFICGIDPSSIEELLDPDFDTHLDIARVAGMLTVEDIEFYKAAKKNYDNLSEEDKERFNNINVIRNKAKTVSYSALYGVGAAKLAKELKIPKSEAQMLLDAFWRKNYAVTKFAADVVTKEVNGQRWALNPLNNIWYSLRSEKDIFSTINQSAGSFIFKLWVNEIRSMGIKITAQFHDEIIIRCKKGLEDSYSESIVKALDIVNNKLNLTVPIKCEVKFNKYYSEIH